MFPAMLTGATQAHLSDPHFPEFAARWVERIARVMVVVPKNAKVQELRGIRYLRSRSNELTLNEVLSLGLHYVDATVPLILQDPLVVTGAAALSVFGIAEQRYLGKAWVAASSALVLDDTGRQGDHVESVGIRWFCGSRNCLVQIHKHLNPNIPFVWPLWSGIIAYGATRHVLKARYHDITSLIAIGCRTDQDPTEPVESTGFGLTVFNPPRQSYVDNV